MGSVKEENSSYDIVREDDLAAGFVDVWILHPFDLLFLSGEMRQDAACFRCYSFFISNEKHGTAFFGAVVSRTPPVRCF
jgi:hypothetical protein